MIIFVAIPAALADVRYKWVAAGTIGAEQDTGITQVGSFTLFRFDVTPPVNAEEMIVYDVNDESNYSLARYPSLTSGSGGATLAEILAGIIIDHGSGSYVDSGSGGGGGSGAFVVTVTVEDEDGDPLQNATVRLTEGINSFTALTDADGVASFALDAATYSRAITKDGYQFAPDEIEVTATGNFDAVMMLVAIALPGSPDAATGHVVTRDGARNVLPGIEIEFQMVSGSGPDSHRSAPFTYVSNGSGLLEGPFAKGARYQCRRGPGSQWNYFTVPDEDIFALPAVLGAP